MTYKQRIRRIAKALGFRRSKHEDIRRSVDGYWYIHTPEGDQPLMNTRGCKTLPEALGAAEAWLAPQILYGGNK